MRGGDDCLIHRHPPISPFGVPLSRQTPRRALSCRFEAVFVSTADNATVWRSGASTSPCSGGTSSSLSMNLDLAAHGAQCPSVGGSTSGHPVEDDRLLIPRAGVVLIDFLDYSPGRCGPMRALLPA